MSAVVRRAHHERPPAGRAPARPAPWGFAPLRECLREKVHKTGSVLSSPDELLTSVTGGGVSPQPFLTLYLRAKYSELYGLEL